MAGLAGGLGPPGAEGGLKLTEEAVAPQAGQASSRGPTSAPHSGHWMVALGGLKHMMVPFLRFEKRFVVYFQKMRIADSRYTRWYPGARSMHLG